MPLLLVKGFTLYNVLLVIALLLPVARWQPVQAQPDTKFDYLFPTPATTAPPEIKPLIFAAPDEVLQFDLMLNYGALLKDRGLERSYHPATITYQDANNQPVTVAAKVMVRGNHRRNPAVCRFPPLTLNFTRKTTTHTLFAGINKLKLVTHCLSEEYIFREYLAYKLYNLLTDFSFRVRLCRINYLDGQGNRKPETKYAFVIEDDTEMAQRNHATLVPKDYFVPMHQTDAAAMARMALFQYMLGNTDWSVPYRHNVKLLQTTAIANPVPVPYDFDYCGLVSAPYAVPPAELNLQSVRHRVYRGQHFTDDVYAQALTVFNSQREKIYALYHNTPWLNKKYLNQTLRFLDDFYEIINSPKSFQHHIVRVGQQNQKSYVVIKGLKN